MSPTRPRACVLVFRCWLRGMAGLSGRGCPLRALLGALKGRGRQRGWVEFSSFIGLYFWGGGWVTDERNIMQMKEQQIKPCVGLGKNTKELAEVKTKRRE